MLESLMRKYEMISLLVWKATFIQEVYTDVCVCVCILSRRLHCPRDAKDSIGV